MAQLQLHHLIGDTYPAFSEAITADVPVEEDKQDMDVKGEAEDVAEVAEAVMGAKINIARAYIRLMTFTRLQSPTSSHSSTSAASASAASSAESPH